MEAKVRIRLERKSDPTDKVTICVKLFDEKNGLMNFPVDLETWNVLEINRGSGLKDNFGYEIYENDDIVYEYNGSSGKFSKTATVIFHDGSFCFKDDTGYTLLHSDFIQMFRVMVAPF